MSETNKGEDDSQDESLSKNDPTTFQKTYRGHDSTDKRQYDSKDSLETTKDSPPAILTQVAHKKSESLVDSPLMVDKMLNENNGDTLLPNTKINHSESNDPKRCLEQTRESFTGDEIKLDSVKIAKNNEKRQKFRREDLTKGELDEICGKDGSGGKTYTKTRTPGLDPRFQQQNQTLRCFVMYTDFYRCEKILGKGEAPCQWFKDVFTTICPLDWVRRWDEAREAGILPWMKGKTQAKFPGDRYGV